ncbi:hypothetical protein BCR34DRAFT_296711 [Clohesyomyces aquaticus]|uniref:Uncharacterized protein n=1 Tax=Clohesyomyces aquaticus TaxID=1231657 RepID=A0A1Y2A8J9_9PLEO|nr:hypothetical protein BCR34DRAFT_296711 [Clohesyomyces aquaticus]
MQPYIPQSIAKYKAIKLLHNHSPCEPYRHAHISQNLPILPTFRIITMASHNPFAILSQLSPEEETQPPQDIPECKDTVPVLIFILGPPLSGKTTLSNHLVGRFRQTNPRHTFKRLHISDSSKASWPPTPHPHPHLHTHSHAHAMRSRDRKSTLYKNVLKQRRRRPSRPDFSPRYSGESCFRAGCGGQEIIGLGLLRGIRTARSSGRSSRS